MKSLTTISLIGILSFSSLLADGQQATVNGDNNLVTQIVNKGLSQKTVDKFIKPYKDRINSLERKLNRTVSIEEKYRLSEQLNKARKELTKKSQEIKDLNEFIENSNLKVVRIATKIYEEKGLEATLKYFKSNAFAKFEKNTQENMKELSGGYRLKAKLLVLDNKYDEAKEAYQKALKYDRNINTLLDYAYFLQNQNYFDEAISINHELLLNLRKSLKRDYSIVNNFRLANLLKNIGSIYTDKMEYKKAEKVYIEAETILQKLVKTSPIIYTNKLAMLFNDISLMYLKKNQLIKAQYKCSDGYLLITNMPKKYRDLNSLVIILNNLGNILKKDNQFKLAEQAYKSAIVYYEKLPNNSNKRIFASTLNGLANLYFRKNQLKKAKSKYLEALNIYKKLTKKNPRIYIPYLAGIYNNLANLYISTNQFTNANNSYKKSLVYYRILAKQDSKIYSGHLGTLLSNMALFYLDNNKMKKAKEVYAEVLILYKSLFKINPKSYGIELANSLVMGVYLLNQPFKNLDEAEIILQEFRGNSNAEQLLKKIKKFRKKETP